MNAVQNFNGLNGAVVSRSEVQTLIMLAHEQGQPHLARRLQTVLDTNENRTFKFLIERPELEAAPAELLACIDCASDEVESAGLGKAVSPKEIYDMITQKVIDALEQPISWQQEWGSFRNHEGGYLIPYNFDSKKPYRGVNVLMLCSFNIYNPDSQLLQNPYFLTFKQIQARGGQIVKGAKASQVVYFSDLYKLEIAERDLHFVSSDLAKVKAYADKHGVSYSNIDKIPLLKYYNVFNGADIDGIDFQLDKNPVKGKIEPVKKVQTKFEKVDIAEAIIKSYPAKAPEIRFGGDEAFYRRSSDSVTMPKPEQFNYVQAYYTTFFHELVHSTGHTTRLDRVLGKKFGDKDYAFEELIAELGASFLSAEAGMLHYTFRNSVAYIKGWRKNLLTFIKDDNKFFFRASSAAQKAVDLMLDRDGNGVAAYEKFVKVAPMRVKKKTSTEKPQTKSVISGRKVIAQQDFSKSGQIFGIELVHWELSDSYQIFFPHFWKRSVTTKNLDIATAEYETELAKLLKKYGKYRLQNVEKRSADTTNQSNSFDKKPKSASVQTAIDNVLTLPKYKGIGKIQASLLFKHFKDLLESEDLYNEIELESEYEAAMFQKESKFYEFYEYRGGSKSLSITEHGAAFVNSVNGRLASLRNQKYNYAMFDGLAGKRKGLKGAEQEPVNTILPDPEQPQPATVNEVVAPRLKVAESNKPAAAKALSSSPKVRKIGAESARESQFYTIDGEVGKFLQRIEKKPTHSVVITMDGEQGAGKTTTLYKFMDAMASAGNKSLFLSLEEHPDSALAIEKRDKYLSAAAQQNIDIAAEVESAQELYELIAPYDVVFTDSWQKLLRMIGQIKLDEDIRKRFNGKVFFFIFQQTTDGRTKGGAEVVFDGDIIIKMVKGARFADNYAYFDKHRYTLVPIENIRYNIATGTVYNPNASASNADESAQTPALKLSFQLVEK